MNLINMCGCCARGCWPTPRDDRADGQVEETVQELQDAAADGVAVSQVRFLADVTPLPDEHVRALERRAKVAGVAVVLVDDRPDRRPGTIRSAALHPHELAVLQQAAATRVDAG
ncbi:hypothetical protein [Actinomadura sp. 6N118]|uniref:hypothetical protein n=1 Tax=Actinomadura sp. 6N118 TaxID=3375151 RepID=UPI0037915A43